MIAKLPYVRDLGFDVLYFTPIHPIGRTHRKGKNNSLTAGPDDPGSPYAIGSEEGGHDAIHPELGTFDDFARLVEAAREHGLEIALDFAIQASQDHPWIKEHPEWFDWRPDGTIKYAENPPKKYEDIVHLHFYDGAFPSIWYALRDVFLFWIGHGVKIFRVDNPHTKPVPFWEWAIRDIQSRHPDTIFLAEAFTRPKVMKRLAKVGLQPVLFLLHLAQHEVGADAVPDRADHDRVPALYAAEFFREHARHQPVFPADERAARLPHPPRARRDARRQLRRL